MVRGGVRGYSGGVTGRVALAFASALAITLGLAAPASADDKSECIAASERAQRMRMDGKLPEARASLLVCARATCPAVVRQDCSVWLSEVSQLMPSIVIAAKAPKGADLVKVRVKPDQTTIAEQLDGKAITVPTGSHTLHAEHEGFAAVDVPILIREGEKARSIEVRFGAAATSSAAPDRAETSGGRSIAPWIVTGVGGATLVTGLVIATVGVTSIPDQCNFTTQSCEPKTPDDVKQKAESKHGLALAGFGVAGVGLLAVAGGLVWHFLEPSGEKAGDKAASGEPRRSVYFAPMFGGAAGPLDGPGAAVLGRF